MRLKQFALAVLCSAVLAVPAFAQTPSAPAMPKTTTPMPSATMPAMKPAMPAAGAPAAATPTTGLTNINSASAADLDKLPQIGPKRAAKIIAGRPYQTTEDLMTKKVLTKGIFDKIKDKITI